MSVFVTKPAWESSVEGPVNRFVMIALADMADPSGYCYPSIRRLARLTGFSESAVKKAIRYLERIGVLRRAPRWTKAGDQTSNGYRFDLATLTAMKAPPPVEEDDNEHPLASLFRDHGDDQ